MEIREKSFGQTGSSTRNLVRGIVAVAGVVVRRKLEKPAAQQMSVDAAKRAAITRERCRAQTMAQTQPGRFFR